MLVAQNHFLQCELAHLRTENIDGPSCPRVYMVLTATQSIVMFKGKNMSIFKYRKYKCVVNANAERQNRIRRRTATYQFCICDEKYVFVCRAIFHAFVFSLWPMCSIFVWRRNWVQNIFATNPLQRDYNVNVSNRLAKYEIKVDDVIPNRTRHSRGYARKFR